MKTLSYFDRLEKHSAFYSPTGNGCIDEYQLKYDKEAGAEILVKIGFRNVDDEIQSFRESAKITNILNRFINGEYDLLNQTVGTYGDFTNTPTSYADYFAKVKEAEKIFEQLPDDIKDKFDNSAEKFFLEFGTDSFKDKVTDPDVVEPMEKITEEFDNAE